MKKIITIAAITAATMATPATAAPGNSSTATGTASATIVAPVKLTHTSGAALHFGTITAGSGGTVSVSTTSVVTTPGDARVVSGTTPAADTFTVAGDASRTFGVTTTGGTVTGPVGSTPMSFTTNTAATGTLNTSGTAGFRVGGTLTVPSAATPGAYTGTYSATATYN